MICRMSLIVPSSFQVVIGQIYSPVIIKGNVDTRVVATGNNILVTVDLTNNDQIPAKGLDVQVISLGFNIVSQIEWT